MNLTRCVCLIVYDLDTSTMRWPRAELECCVAEKEFFLCRKLFIYSQLVNVIILWLKDLQLP